MKTGLQKSALTLALLITLLSATMPATINAAPVEPSAQIDVFTNKQPYSGKGSNVPSDAFAPDEIVILYAMVIRNGFPLENMLVAFHVTPPNNVQIDMSAQTNSSGIATVNFTIPTPPIGISEDNVFGNWSIVGSVMVEQKVIEDLLSFRVDWIVKLLSLDTVDENLTHRDYFGRGGDVGLKITLRSIAMTLRNATLAWVVQDELNIVVNSSIIQNFLVQPDEKLIILYCKATLPPNTHVGTAKVSVTALTPINSNNGVPYCPALSTQFNIEGIDPLTINYVDAAAVIVLPSAKSIELGDSLSLTTTVRNEGTKIANFSIQTYFDDTLLSASTTVSLLPYAVQSFQFSINASLLTIGNHTIRASIPPLTNETDLTDNEYVDMIQVTLPNQQIHDVAITNVQPSSNTATIGTVLEITVTTKNLGTTTESFNVTAYYNTSIIGTIQVQNLEPQTQKPLTFHWDTSDAQNITTGNFEISATASPVPSEENLENNHYTDGIVQIQTPTETHDIAVTNVTPQSRFVYVGDFLDVNVTVKNKGTQTESFQLTLIYDQINNITTINVDNLAAGTERNIIFHWNTTTISVGNHTISAYAKPVPLEENTGDNTLTDGQVQFAIATKGIPLPDWFPWFLLLLLLIILLTALFIYYYKRRKESKTAFHSGWTAWYYTYDPHTKPHNPTKRTSRQGARTRRTRKPTTTTQKRLTHSTRHF